jgi:hypothetical protein
VRLDERLENHGLHQGLSPGWLPCVWLAYILSEGAHRKAGVADRVARHRHTLAGATKYETATPAGPAHRHGVRWWRVAEKQKGRALLLFPSKNPARGTTGFEPVTSSV